MHIISRRYRAGIYSLLVGVLACGIGLSVLMDNTASEIRKTAVPLLQDKVPKLRYLGDFESALLRHQLALNKYFAESITRERLLVLEEQTQTEMDENFARVHESFLPMAGMPGVEQIYRQLSTLTDRYNDLMLAPAVDQHAVRDVLSEVNVQTNLIRQQLDALQAQTEQMVYQSSEATSNKVDDINRLVQIFSGIIFIIGLLLLYHVRARFRSENELAFQAAHDPLTGLAHRRSFEQRLLNLPSHPHTIVLGTIDRFERLVGSLGHAGGDNMLQAIVERIRIAAQRHGGDVYRLDGANIAILYEAALDHTAFDLALASLQVDMRQSFEVDRYEIFASLSLGAAEFPQHGSEPAHLLRNADAALQAARAAGGDCLIAYSQTLNVQTQDRLSLESALRHAIERNELELHYQPQQRLQNDELLGFEALVRWRHDGKLISPAEFIPLAEESGMIIAIGDWVIAEACRQTMIWSAMTERKLVVAVNISPRQFRHPDFVQKLEKTLAESHVDPASIELEITEGIVMEGADTMILLLEHLRQLGLKLAIDDFGTGYSSLAYLKRFPIDKLKIDQSFVRNLQPDSEDAAIVEALINLGHNLGMTVIAEGVETAEQRAWLRDWSCDEIQGYFYSRPLPSDAATAFIAAH
jgi:diguanylate cyclase (GGDEF)-like protein